MKSARDTGLVFPTTLSSDEKRLRETLEKLRAIRKAIIATNKVNVSATVGDNLKTERKTTKRHIQQAEEATEEVKRKVLIGAVSFKKADEKKDSFKRSSLIGRRRDVEKAKTEGDTVNNNSTELLSPSADDNFDTYKPFSSDSHAGTSKAATAATTTATTTADNFDTYKPISDDFDNYKGGATDIAGSNKSGSNFSSQKISTDRPSSDSFDTYKPLTSDDFDTYKPLEGATSSFDNYKPVITTNNSGDGGGNNDDGFDTYNAPTSSFDTHKEATSGDDGFDNYKPGQTQPSSFDSGSSPFGGSEQPKSCRGPCLYIRGYDLVADSLRNVFSKYGIINRIFVEERQKSAFITYAKTEEAETAIKEMDGNMVNGITLRVSFARRQNQGDDFGRFRGGRSYDRGGDGGNRGRGDRGNHFRGERSGRFYGGERGRFRGDKGARNRGRGRTSESGDFSWPAASENKDDYWSGASRMSNEGWQAAETSSGDKDDFWSVGKRSPERKSNSGWPAAETDKDKEEDNFDTYKPTISAGEKDDFDTWKPASGDRKDDDGFDTYKPSGSNIENDDGFDTWSPSCTTSRNRQDSLGERSDSFRERRGGFSGDRRGGFRGDRRGGRRSRRGNGNRGDASWQPRRRDSGRKGDDYWSTGDSGAGWPAADESKDKDDFWPSGGRSSKTRNTNVIDDDNWPVKRLRREGSLQKGDNEDDLWPSTSRPSDDKHDEPWTSSSEKTRGDRRSFQEGNRGDRKVARKGGGGFRRQHLDLDNSSTRSVDESDKSPSHDIGSKGSLDAWPVLPDDKVPSSPPPPPPMSDVQVAWSEATKKASKEIAATTTAAAEGDQEGAKVIQHKPEVRMQVTYDEDDPFA